MGGAAGSFRARLERAWERSGGFLCVGLDPDLPKVRACVPDSDRPDAGAPAAELYAAYHRRAHEREPAPAVLDTFQHLHERAREDA